MITGIVSLMHAFLSVALGVSKCVALHAVYGMKSVRVWVLGLLLLSILSLIRSGACCSCVVLLLLCGGSRVLRACCSCVVFGAYTVPTRWVHRSPTTGARTLRLGALAPSPVRFGGVSGSK